MKRTFPLIAVVFLSAASCRVFVSRPEAGPAAFTFPPVLEGSLKIEGAVIPPLRSLGDVVLIATREGRLFAVEMTYRRVVWTFDTKNGLADPPEVSDRGILLLDKGNILYGLGPDGVLTSRISLGLQPSTAVREWPVVGRLVFGTGDGRVLSIDRASGAEAWEFRSGGPVRSGPVFSGDLAYFGTEDGKLFALDASGREVWSFAAQGPIARDPGAAGGRVCFGTRDRYFYCLDAASGKRKWMRRLDGAPVNPPLLSQGRAVVAASDSVVYCLSVRSGEILWWRSVASRLIHAPVVAKRLVLVAGGSSGLDAYEFETGRGAGSFSAGGELLAGPVWTPPRIVLLEAGENGPGPDLAFLTQDVRLLLSAGRASPQAPGTPVDFEAASSGFERPLYIFYLVQDGRRTLRKGPSKDARWTWRAGPPGHYAVIVRAYDRLQSREAQVRFTVEKPSGKQ
jgi:outer membrane protein assembly factor BamB